MFFSLSKIIWLIINPGNLLLIGLLFGGLLAWRSKPGWKLALGRFLLCSSIAILLFISVVPVGQWLMMPLEGRFTQPEDENWPDDVTGIICLGGVLNEQVTEARRTPALNHGSDRLPEMIRLMREYPKAKVVFTGGSGRLKQGGFTEAEYVQNFLESLGMNTGRIIFEANSRNTFQNAKFSKGAVSFQENDTWLLITSARHMPRAVGVFRAEGWPGLIPIPVDYQTTGSKPEFRFSLSAGVTELNAAAKEWVGLLAYYMAGKTNALFPGPEMR